MQRVEIARFKPLYAGLFLAVLILVSMPLVFPRYCESIYILNTVAACPLSLLVYIASALILVAVHEATHYAAAVALRVRGARLLFNKKLVAVMLDYDYMTPGQYLLVTLAPQILTPILLYLATLHSIVGGIACVMAAANLAGGAPDVVNALYFWLVHGDAERFYLLYRWDGMVEGGVVEYEDKIIVYVM